MSTPANVGSIIRIASPGIQGPPGPGTTSGTLSAASTDGELITVGIISNWGISSDGVAYYDTAGASPDEAAIASIDENGHITLTTLSES